MAECAKKSLELPVEPEKRVRLYEVWGDAEARAGDANLKVRAAHRKAAALLRLQGVAEFRKLDFTAAAFNPPLPGADRPLSSLSPGEQMLRQAAVQRNARRIGAITIWRDACLGCIAYEYQLFPYAPDGELRAIVMEKLNDAKLADELVSKVDKAIAAKKAQMAAYSNKREPPVLRESNENPVKHDLPQPRGRGRLVLVLSSFLLILTVVLVARRWRASHRTEQP